MTADECARIVDETKTSKQNLYSFPDKLFKKYKIYLIETLCEIVNKSFARGIFPDRLKSAVVIPIFKKGDKTLISNYRPISILTFYSKIFEKCILIRLTDYISKFSIISSSQFGFTKGKSTQDAVVSLTELIYDSFNRKKINASICVDLRKAFDTIDYTILLSKLETYGIRGLPLRLIKSYLSNRTQRVKVGSDLSDPRKIALGLPQGGLLSPISFLLFINDLLNNSSNFHTLLFADDTTLNVDGSIEEIISKCSLALEKLSTWIIANRVSLNVEKTLFANTTKFPISVSHVHFVRRVGASSRDYH